MPTYRPWQYANRQELRARDAKAFRNNAAVYEEEQQARRQPAEVNPLDRVRSGGTDRPLAEARKKSGGLFGKLKDLGGDALDVGKDVGGGTLKALDSVGNNTLRPLMGVASGQTEAERKPILDAQGRPTGKFYRSAHDPNRQRIGLGPLGDIDVSSFKQAGKALKDAATQNPLDTFREGKQAWAETQRDPEMSTAKKVILAGATDPLTFIGPGAVKGALRAAPAAVQASRAARVAGVALESPRMASVGGVVGAAGAAEAAERADLSPGWQTAATLAGGVAGGVVGGSGAARQALKGKGPLRGMGGSIVEESNPHLDKYLNTLERHGVEFRYGDDGSIHVADRRAALERADRIEARGAEQINGTATPGGNPGSGNPFHFGTKEYEDFIENRRKMREEAVMRGQGMAEDAPEKKIPDANASAIEDMDDAERIREVVKLGRVDPEAEARRTHFPEGARLEKHEPLLDHERAVLEEAAPDRSKGNAKRGREAAALLGEDDAVRFTNDLIAPDMNPRGVSAAILSEIEARGFDKAIGRTNLSVREKAFRAKLQSIADELYNDGHAAITTEPPRARDMGAGPEPPRVESVPEAKGTAGETVKRIDLEGNVTDTFQTEAELNGIRQTQGGMLLETDSNSNHPPESGETGPKFQSEEPLPPPPPLGKVSDHGALGLDPSKTYTEAEIKDAYRAQARRYHPDVNQSPTASADMKRINNAYDNLRARQSTGPRYGAQGSRYTEPDDWKKAWDDARRKAREERNAFDKEWQDFKKAREGNFGEGFPGGRETGGVGGAAGQGNMMPPREPGEPGVPTGRPQAPFGQEQPGVDLIDGVSRDELMARESKFLATKGGKAEQAIRKVLARLGFGHLAPNLIRDPKFTPIWQEMNRVTNMRQSAKALVESMWRTAERSGLKLEQQADGNWLVAGTTQHLGDVVEQATPEAKAVWDSFDPKVKEALTDMTTLMDEARQTVEHHGGEMPLIDVEGAYFPRKVAAIAGQDRNEGAIGGRRLGARQGFQKARTEADMVNAAASDQVTYAHPLDAFEAGFDAKLRVAQDAYVTNLLKPLVVPNAKAGFGGLTEVPNVGVMNEADALRAQGGLAPRQQGTIENTMSAVNRKLTPIRASYDASGLFQQGMRRWLTDPKGAAKDWRVALRSLKDPDVYHAAVKEYDEAGPGLKYLARRGLRITAEGEANEVTRLTGAAPTGTTRAAGKLKGAAETGQRISSEIYDRPLNLHRLAAANGMYKRLEAKGLTGAALDAEMDAGMKAVNRMYGWTGMRPSSIESAALFAPRYFRANIETIVKAASDGGIEGSEARKHLALLAGEGAALVLAINTARGHETEFDPRSSNFMRIRDVGGLDVSPYGGYDILMRAIAGTIGGDATGGIDPDVSRLGRLAWGKASPSLKLVIEPLKGETYMGKPIDPLGNPADFVWEQFKSSVPFGAQNLIEGVEDGEPGNAVKSTLVGSLGVSQQPMTPAERRDAARDAAAKEQFGKSYADLPGAEKAQVNERAGVSKWQQQADKRAKNGSGSDFERSTKIRETVAQELDASAKYLESGKDDAGNPFSGNDFRKSYNDTMLRAAGARSQVKDFDGGNKDVGAWFDLYDKATMPNGQVDFDKLERLQGEFRSSHPGIDAAVDKTVGVHDNAAVRELREAKKLAHDYYQLPAYKGMTLEQAEKAGTIINIANDLVQFGKARDRDAALRALRSYDAEGVRLAKLATRRGSNPARARFRKANPLFATYYSETSAVAEQ